MARIQNNILFEGASGSVGKYIIKQRNGKTYIARKPKKPAPQSEAQKASSKRFREAMQYAVAALQNPELAAFYQSKAGNGKSACNMAVADYCKPPVIGNVNTENYNGHPGDVIRMCITDNGRVVSARVSISKNDVVAEEGEAVVMEDGITWIYVAITAIDGVEGMKIDVRAWDLAGRESFVVVALA